MYWLDKLPEKHDQWLKMRRQNESSEDFSSTYLPMLISNEIGLFLDPRALSITVASNMDPNKK